jgi:hypothetical protein
MHVRLVLAAIVTAAACALAPAASAYTSFSVYITSAYAYSYSNTLSVRASAYYRDSDCTPSYSCDRNVLAEFTLHRGFSRYSPIMARAYDETGQYGLSLSAEFRLPSCRYIARYKSQTYTVVVNAVAPDGEERTSSRTVYVRSCA